MTEACPNLTQKASRKKRDRLSSNTTQEEESQQAELANTIWSNRVRNEAIGVSRNLHRPVPSQCANAPNFNFFFLNYPFTAWGVAASRAQHLAKSFIPSSIPTIPARMKTHITADSKKTDTAARRPTPPTEDTTPTPKEIDTSDSEKTDTATRRHHRRHRGDRRHRIREERRHQKNNHHYPRNAESILYQTLPPPHPTPKQAKAKAKANSKQFFSQANTNKGTIFSQTPFHFFQFFFKTKE